MTVSRRVAYDVLRTVRSSDQPFQALLDQRFAAAGHIDLRDRSLATELVTGVLRHRLTLDWVISHFSSAPLSKIEPDILDALRLGVYQLVFLDRVPDSAAVNETVNLVKKRRARWVTGFVNAALRAVQRSGRELEYPDPRQDPVKALSVRFSHPEWLARRWLERYGAEKTERLMNFNNQPPPRAIRVNGSLTGRDELLRILQKEGADEVRPMDFSPDGILVSGMKGSLYELDSFKQGLWIAQDEAAQLISYLLPAPRGGRALDLCAGRGGKAGHLAQVRPDLEQVVALEISEPRVRELQRMIAATALAKVQAVRADALQFAANWKGEGFDAVMVDAPCTGTGTIRRRPDIKWKDFPKALPALTRTQRSLLRAAADLTREDGYLLYVTCSLEPEENEHNVRWFLEERRDFASQDLRSTAPAFARPLIDADGIFRVWPPDDRMDGFFAALFKKRAKGRAVKTAFQREKTRV